MNILLFLGLVLFVILVFWLCFLFVSNTVETTTPKQAPKEPVYDDVLERCQKLYDQGFHAELQRFAQRELAKNYGDVELRKILAQSLMESGNEQMAIMHYEAILNINSYDIKTQEILAQYYSENGPKSKAINHYEQILMYDSGNINAVETLAKLYDEMQNYDKAIEMYQLILDAELDEQRIIELKYVLADLYMKVDDSEKSFDMYEKIHREDEENLEVLILLADLAYKNKYWQDCLKYYKKIISIVGDDFEILEKIAQMQVILENWPEAVDAYKKILTLEDSSNLNYLYHQNELCNAMLKNGRYKEAISLLKDLLVQHPKETSFAFTLAQAYTLMGEFQIGVNLYNKLLDELPPEQSEIIIKYISNLICAWAQDLFKKGEYNHAFDKFFEALKYDEENDEVYFQLGKCNYYIKSFQDSIAHFKRAISIKPQESMYYFGLGCAYDEMGQTKNAKMAFYDAVNINPMNTQARIAYAISLTKELEYAQSIEQFNNVLKYIPNNADTMYNLALAYDLVGDIERAIKHYKQALDVEPKHKEARHNLELLLGEPYNPEEEIEYTEDIPSAKSTEEEINNIIEEQAQEEDLNLDFDIPQGGNSSMFG
ncbi:MAG: tetratricopeptide repeat protein [Candidatus Gastranaerophilales bacterium]|nr:tetratricopeptide repeat protein [Candidatus Gastranaerophilales bacterium]